MNIRHLKLKNLIETVSDADFASGDDRKSTTGFCIFLNGIPVYSTSRRQQVIALSSMESELYAMPSSRSRRIVPERSGEFHHWQEG